MGEFTLAMENSHHMRLTGVKAPCHRSKDYTGPGQQGCQPPCDHRAIACSVYSVFISHCVVQQDRDPRGRHTLERPPSWRSR